MRSEWLKRKKKEKENKAHAQSRYGVGLVASAVGIGINVLLFAFKLVIGAVSGSVSITADAFNNLSDAASSAVSLVGFRLAGKPADEEHPYGHGRYEYLAAMMVSVMILVIGVQLLGTSVRRVFKPTAVTLGVWGAIVLLVSMVLKLWLATFYKRVGRQIESKTLAAAAQDSRNDVLATSAVLAGTIVSRMTGFEMDGLFGVGVAFFILVEGTQLLRETIGFVVGRMPDHEVMEAIRKKVLSYPGVLGAHDLMVHDYGPGRQFASVHVEMSASEDPMDSHEIIDRMEKDFLTERALHLVVHYDPVALDDPRLPLMRALIERELNQIDPRITAHDLRIARRADGTLLTLDCVAPYGASVTGEQLGERLTEAMQREFPCYRCAVTLEHGLGEDGVSG